MLIWWLVHIGAVALMVALFQYQRWRVRKADRR
jgi:hypothetical protein